MKYRKSVTAVIMEQELTQDLLKKLVHYDPDTGVFTRLVSFSNAHKPSVLSMRTPSHKYHMISVLGRRYVAHRLAWLYIHGRFPSNHIDHINGAGKDNRLCNLREATNRENSYNLAPKRDGVPTGAYFDKRYGTWGSKIRIAGKSVHLGTYTSAIEASLAYQYAARQRSSEFFPRVEA